MTDIIHLLPDHITNQIKAGEVVQRPASAVKELMENCIDAGATKIEVNLKDAGRTLIQIVDNGKGMSLLDSRMCFERHTTSKIKHTDDLSSLNTKGFRGEALASIAAISQVSLSTRRAEDELGILTLIEGSIFLKQEPIQCPVGSNFEIKNLFYNIPVRRNFLKSDQIEYNHIEDEFQRISLAHPEIQFKLIHNDDEKFNLQAAPLRKRIVDVFGKGMNDKLVPLTEQTDIVGIEGFVGKPQGARKTRGEQFLFVNNRFFKDAFFNHALMRAYEQILAPKLFPSYFLYFTVDPKYLDVNVHPMKTEVKFQEDKAIYAILKTAVRSALGKFNIAPTLDFERETAFELPYDMRFTIPKEPQVIVDSSFNPFKKEIGNNNGFSKKDEAFSSAVNKLGFGSINSENFEALWKTKNEDLSDFFAENEIEEQLSLIENDSHAFSKPFLIQGGLLVSSLENGLAIVHYRRAKERIVYNNLMKDFMRQPLHAQQLLFPLERLCSRDEKRLWEEHEKTLLRIGFSWIWHKETIAINTVPEVLSEHTMVSSIDAIMEALQMHDFEKSELAHILIKQLSFAHSAFTKSPTDQEQIQSFIDSWKAQDDFQFTPGGKPIFHLISSDYLLQLFQQ